MLTMPEAPPFYRLVSIDPGTIKLGLSLIDYNLVDQTITVRYAQTLSAATTARTWPFMSQTQGDRFARLHSHRQFLTRFFQDTGPRAIISEGAHMGRFANAYQALVECIAMLQSVTVHYDPAIALQTLDATSVKRNVGAPSHRPKSMSKEAFKESVREALASKPYVLWAPGVDLYQLDEHGVDACAVGVSWLLHYVPSIDPG